MSRLRTVYQTIISKTPQLISLTDGKAESLAIHYLKSECVIAVPTDTVYGVACTATSPKAVNDLFSIKCRDENKPVAVCLSDINELSRWAIINHLPNDLLHNLLPGPVTLILNCASKLNKSLSYNGKVGIRIPDNDFIRSLVRGLGNPIALTSANLSGEPNSVRVEEFKSIWDKLGAVFDGGCLQRTNNASTIVDLSTPGCFYIVREGVAFSKTVDICKRYNLCEIKQ